MKKKKTKAGLDLPPKPRPLIEGSFLQQWAFTLCLGLFCAWERAPLLLLVIALGCFKRLSPFALFILFFSFWWGGHLFQAPAEPLDFGTPRNAQVKLLRLLREGQGYNKFLAEIRAFPGERLSEPFKAELYFRTGPLFPPGTLLQVEASFKPIGGRMNPFGYDIQKIKEAQGILWRGYVKHYQYLGREASWIEGLRFRLFLFARKLSPAARGLFEALILGNRAYLPQELLDKFERLGIFHLLAISGMHLGLLVGLLWGLTRLFLYFYPSILLKIPEKILVFGVSFPLVFLYALVSGPTPSALRATVMLALLTFGFSIYREIRGLDVLSLAVSSILIVQPATIGSLSFRLSVSAVLALILASRLKSRFSLPRARLWRYLWESLYYSVVATLATAPWLLLFKGKFSLLSPLGNLLAIPLFSLLVLPLEGLSAFLSLVAPHLASFLAELAVRLVEILPQGTKCFFTSPYPVGAFLWSFLPFLLGPFWGRKGLKTAFCLFVILQVAFLFLTQKSRYFILLDVGQGSAAFFKLKERNLLFDAGPKWLGFDAGHRIVGPLLHKLGIKVLDIVLISHKEADHAGGLISLAKEFKIRELLSSQKLDLPFRKVKNPFFLEGNGFYLWGWPPNSPSSSLNEASLVAKVCVSSLCFLFPGDISQRRERELLAQKVPLKAHVLLLPHHGSRTSSGYPFLKAVAPALALSSSAWKYHPSPEVLERLSVLGIKHLGTKSYGAISLLMEKEKVWLCTERARREHFLLVRALWPFWPAGCTTWIPSHI